MRPAGSGKQMSWFSGLHNDANVVNWIQSLWPFAWRLKADGSNKSKTWNVHVEKEQILSLESRHTTSCRLYNHTRSRARPLFSVLSLLSPNLSFFFWIHYFFFLFKTKDAYIKNHFQTAPVHKNKKSNTLVLNVFSSSDQFIFGMRSILSQIQAKRAMHRLRFEAKASQHDII